MISVRGGCSVIRLTSRLETWWCQRISRILLRHHRSSALIFLALALDRAQHSDPYSIIGKMQMLYSFSLVLRESRDFQMHMLYSNYMMVLFTLVHAVKYCVRMFYRPGTGRCCCTGTWQMLCVHSALSTHQAATLYCVKWRNSRHLESITLCPKSDSISWCVLTWRTFLPNFVPIRFETTEP